MDLALLLLLAPSPTIPIEKRAAVEETSSIATAKTNRYFQPKYRAGQSCPIGCLCDQGEAVGVSRSRGIPIVFWVNMVPSDSPIIRAEMPDAVHCCLSDNNGDDTPRLIICRPGDARNGATWKASEFDDEAPDLIAKQIARLTRPVAMERQILPTIQIPYAEQYPMMQPAMVGSSSGGG